ncbi:MAG: hypothetical protein NTZ37_06655 [Methanoregula sp.]|nr:hypothetical protein [Methanoregula sp.]
MTKITKLARILAVIVGVIVIVLSFAKFFPLSNEGLVLAVFLDLVLYSETLQKKIGDTTILVVICTLFDNSRD